MNRQSLFGLQSFWEVGGFSPLWGVGGVVGHGEVLYNQMCQEGSSYIKSWLFSYRCDSDIFTYLSSLEIGSVRGYNLGERSLLSPQLGQERVEFLQRWAFRQVVSPHLASFAWGTPGSDLTAPAICGSGPQLGSIGASDA